jgi:hypothetical protein
MANKEARVTEKVLLRAVADEKELLSRVVQMLASTFSPIRTTRRNQTIRLSARAAGTFIDAHATGTPLSPPQGTA